MFRFLTLVFGVTLSATTAVAAPPTAELDPDALAQEIAKVKAFQARTQLVAQRTSSTPRVSATTTHTVRAGDTLYSLAREHDTTVSQIQDANGLDDTGIRLGQEIRIPSRVAVRVDAPTAPPGSVPANTVKLPEEGDIDVPTSGRVFQAISTEIIDRPYAVLPGDSLSSIAERACTTAGTLQELNLLSGDNILPGQMLELPKDHCLD